MNIKNKIFKLLIISFISLLPLACSHHVIYESPPLVECQKGDECPIREMSVLIDNSFSPSEQDLLRLALTSWPNYHIIISTSFVNKDELLNIDSPNFISIEMKAPLPYDGSNETPLGWTIWNDSAAYVQIKPDLNDNLFLPVAIHELGHAFHMVHYTGPYPAIMHPAVYANDYIQCQDLMDYCSIWGCSPKACDLNVKVNLSNPIGVESAPAPVFISVGESSLNGRNECLLLMPSP